MRELMALYGDRIAGAISGWDRIRFRGTVRWLASLRGIGSCMAIHGVLLRAHGLIRSRRTARLPSATNWATG